MAAVSNAPASLAVLDEAEPRGRPGLEVRATDVARVLRRGSRILDDVTLTIEPGEVVAIIGTSGAGKTTLLDALAGVHPASHGTVRYDGLDIAQHGRRFRTLVGYVPQDDIIHKDLAVETTLRYAARLRLPDDRPAAIDRAVQHTLATLDLLDRASVRVGSLSGGQRKRVSIAAELLTRPRALFLDEPTSGLDPGTARALMTTLGRLAGEGTTVVLTTHNPDDLGRCDHIVVLGRGGHLAFFGSIDDALLFFGASCVTEIYELVADPTAAAMAAQRFAGFRADPEVARPAAPAAPDPAVPEGRTSTGWSASWSARWAKGVRQWAVLCRRNLDVLRHNRLTLAIMLGAPVLVVAMFALLFRSGAFDAGQPRAVAAVSITYWLAFASFFFGLTYGLLQIVTEAAILRRERLVNLGVVPYLLAKVTVLVPVLLAVNVAMLVVLRATGRLPEGDTELYVALTITLLLDAVVALTLGLLASAAVTDPSHATLALPLLCFPAVLFSGAVLPVAAMAGVGRAISVVTSDRWAFEALGRQLGLDGLLSHDGSGHGPQLLAEHGGSFSGGAAGPLVAMVLFGIVFLASTHYAIVRRTTP